MLRPQKPPKPREGLLEDGLKAFRNWNKKGAAPAAPKLPKPFEGLGSYKGWGG